MAQTIKLKRSATSGAIPSTASLELGEVAINTYDGKMYIKKNVGGTETVVEVGAGDGLGSASYLEAGMIEYEYTATLNQTIFSGADDNSATLSYTADSILVFLNGVLQDDGVDYTATDGTSVVFSVGLAAEDEVRIVAFTNVTSLSTLNNPTKLDAISTVNGQAAYSLTLNTSAYTPSSETALIVSLNGITQEPGDSFTTSGSTITFAPALVTGDVIDYIVDMGRAVPIGEYSGDLAVGGELEVTGGIIGDLRGATLFKATAGETLAKGEVVYISGISGNTTVVSKADADDAAKMPAFGLVAAAASSNNPVDIYTFGELSGLDTSSFSEGDELFVSTTAGTLTNSAPTGESSKLQKIAKVTRSDNSAGSVFIMGAGRSNAVPNLDDGDIFIGNASNQSVSASLNTKIEEYLDSGTSTPTFSTLDAGNTTLTGYLRGPSTFTIDPAAHGDDTGTLVVAGNLQVDGTTTTINSTTMTVDDLNITLASGAANAAAANGAGITVDGASATLTYNGTNDAWSFNKNVGIGTDSPGTQLEVASTTNGTIRITGDGANTADNPYGSLEFYNLDSSAGGPKVTAKIEAQSAAALSPPQIGGGGQLVFYAGGALIEEQMRIDVSGNVITGSNTANASDAVTLRQDGTVFANNVQVSNGNGAVGGITPSIYSPASASLAISTNSTERLRIDDSGKVGIGTGANAILSTLHVEGDASSSVRIKSTGADSFGRLLLQNDARTYYWEVNGAEADSLRLYDATSAAERLRVDASGRVGIKETNPEAELHISSGSPDLILEDTSSSSAIGSSNRVRFRNNTGTYSAQIGNDPSIDSGQNFTMGTLVGYPAGIMTNGSTRLLVDVSGNVGIGTASPSAVASATTLHVNDDTNGGAVRIGDATANMFIDCTTAGGTRVRANTGEMLVGTNSAADLNFITGSTERMRIDSNGNVGIGADNVTADFEVRRAGFTEMRLTRQDSSINITNGLGALHFTGSEDGITYTDAASIVAVAATNWSAGDNGTEIYFTTTPIGTTSPQERMRIDDSGRVGIGIGNPTATLQVYKPNTTAVNTGYDGAELFLSGKGWDSNLGDYTHGWKFSTPTAGYSSSTGHSNSHLVFSQMAADGLPGTASPSFIERMRIGSAGQLGIGGANYGTSGQVLTSNGSASAPSWQDAGGSTTAGAVGTYGYFAAVDFVTYGYINLSFGDTISGSRLYSANIWFKDPNAGLGTGSDYQIDFTASQSGTWRCMGYISNRDFEQFPMTLFLRIS